MREGVGRRSRIVCERARRSEEAERHVTGAPGQLAPLSELRPELDARGKVMAAALRLPAGPRSSSDEGKGLLAPAARPFVRVPVGEGFELRPRIDRVTE